MDCGSENPTKVPINNRVIICEEWEESIKSIFKSVDFKENEAEIKSAFVALKGKKSEEAIEELGILFLL